jgi:hypothetical protein
MAFASSGVSGSLRGAILASACPAAQLPERFSADRADGIETDRHISKARHGCLSGDIEIDTCLVSRLTGLVKSGQHSTR